MSTRTLPAHPDDLATTEGQALPRRRGLVPGAGRSELITIKHYWQEWEDPG
jgi:hypothetical protein